MTSLTTTSLFGKLREHELEMNRLNVQESEDKDVRNIALKAAKHNNRQDSSEEENLSLLSKKFSKFLKRNRNKESNKERYGNKKTSDFNSNNYTCFGCGEQGHIKADCPNKEGKEKKSSNKERKGKSKRAYISWDENEVSSSSEDEKANLCLMVEGDDDSSSSSSVSSCTSLSAENYSQLLNLLKKLMKKLTDWLSQTTD